MFFRMVRRKPEVSGTVSIQLRCGSFHMKILTGLDTENIKSCFSPPGKMEKDRGKSCCKRYCWNVDAEVTKTILVDKMRIPMGDIVKVEAPGKIFETRWEDQSVSWDT